MTEILGNKLITEVTPFNVVDAGSTRQNFFLKGLAYKITVKVKNTVNSIFLYSSDTFQDKTNKFNFTNQGDGVWTYKEIAGQNATSSDVWQKEGTSFTDIAELFFKVVVEGKNGNIEFDRKFFVGDPTGMIRAGNDLLPYISPHPILFDDFEIPIDFLPNAKNQAGVRKYGGIKTVEIFDDVNAPSSGSHVTTVTETSIDEIQNITVPDRTSSGKIPNFIPPPGTPDFSNFYHFITFRLRSKAGSVNFKDINIIFFSARKCKGKDGVYGYDSTGEVLPAPTITEWDITTTTIKNPPPTCSSNTILTMDNPCINLYATTTTVTVRDNPGGSIIAQGEATPISTSEVQVNRSDMGGDLNCPVSGHFSVSQTGPDQQSGNEIETSITNCQTPPVEISTVTKLNGDNQITIDPERTFDPTKTYTVQEYDTQYQEETPEERQGTVESDTEMTYENTGNSSGFIQIIEDDVKIVNTRFEFDLPDTEIPELPAEDSSFIFDPQNYGNRSFLSSGEYYRVQSLDSASSPLSTDPNATYRLFVYEDASLENFIYVSNIDGIKGPSVFSMDTVGIPFPSFINSRKWREYFANENANFEYFKAAHDSESNDPESSGQFGTLDTTYATVAEYSSITGNRSSIPFAKNWRDFAHFQPLTRFDNDSSGNLVYVLFRTFDFPASLDSGTQAIMPILESLEITGTTIAPGNPLPAFDDRTALDVIHSFSDEFDDLGGAIILKPDTSVTTPLYFAARATDPGNGDQYLYHITQTTQDPSTIPTPS